MSGYTYSEKAETRVNFIDSEVGLVFKTCQVDDTIAVTDEYGNKTVKAGTIYPADGSTAKGIIFEDVDVTHGEKTASLLVAGRVLKDRLNISSAGVTALKAVGFTFVDVPVISRTLVNDLGYVVKTAGTFTASNIAEADDGSTLTITEATSKATSIATVAVADGTVTVTKVKAGTTTIACVVTDETGTTSTINVNVELS